MAMIVDKAGRDGSAVGVDRAVGRAAQLADLGDLAVLDPDIAAKRRHPRAVDYSAILDQQVIRHRFLLLGRDCPVANPQSRPGSVAPRAWHTNPRAGSAMRIMRGCQS